MSPIHKSGIETRNENLASDPVGLEIIWGRLVAIADEAATTLVRTSFSPIVRESNDFSCVIFDSAGRAIAENTIGIPSFNMTISRTLEHLLRWRPIDDWQAGDVACTNDPWLTSGHLPDMTVIAPVFLGERLLGWTGSVAHHSDIGGTLWSADTQSVFEEGIRVPPTLLVDRGRLVSLLIDILRANVRLPEQVIGDLTAQIAAGDRAAQRLVELVRENEIHNLDDIAAEIHRRCDQAMRQAVAEIPDGMYCAEHDLDGTGEEPIHLEVAIAVAGSDLIVDYSGTSGQVRQALNVVMNYTEAYTCYALKCALDPSTPRTDGSYNCVNVTAPAGSILNPAYPAAVNARQLVGHCLATVIYKALAPALPKHVLAESGSAPTLRVVISGIRTGSRPFTSILFVNGGMGARPTLDGLPATCFPSNVICGAMEVIEATAPLRIWRKELRADSGGAGQYRGGHGQTVEIEVLEATDCTLSLFVEHVEHPPEGLLGGHPGAGSRLTLNGATGGFPLKGRSAIQRGDRLTVEYPGGGGYGDTARRDPAAVDADVAAGLITKAVAQELYGR